MNSNPRRNQNRNVAIIVGEAWDVSKIEKDAHGGLLALTLSHDSITLKVICAYLPPMLDLIGKPSGLLKKGKNGERQKEALEAYETISRWVEGVGYWVLAGDLNETRNEKLDRYWSTRSKYCAAKRKFINEFLEESQSVDLWRVLFPTSINGHTRRDHRTNSTARLDYVILSESLHRTRAWQKTMWVGGSFDDGSDHQPLYVSLLSDFNGGQETSLRAWSVRRPRIPTDPERRDQLSRAVNAKWQELASH
jgi:exonuclease III